ncbi:MAG TPA: permease [Prolixibacteraceae bacterium]|nr:permease [Prolixibacteraceae bacterium]
MEQITYILTFVFQSFLHVWPYLLITIPLAVWMNLSDFSRHFKTLMSQSPWLSILLATVVGAFSPFCSCGVIPVISSLLLGGVPLAPVFAFWVASPSMDPEIFFLSVSVLGWKLAIWRLASTFCISLLAGVITHLLVKSGYITTYLRVKKEKDNSFSWGNVLSKAQMVFQRQNRDFLSPAAISCCVSGVQYAGTVITCCDEKPKASSSCACSSTSDIKEAIPLGRKIWKESLKSVWMISRFMGLAFLLNALLNLYVPQESIGRLLNQQGFVSVIIAAVLGVPVYTSNLTALPLVSGLLQLGLHPGAALAFLISGPMTTIPAMVAVYGITSRKVFGLYLFFALSGALLFGMLCYFLG